MVGLMVAMLPFFWISESRKSLEYRQIVTRFTGLNLISPISAPFRSFKCQLLILMAFET